MPGPNDSSDAYFGLSSKAALFLALTVITLVGFGLLAGSSATGLLDNAGLYTDMLPLVGMGIGALIGLVLLGLLSWFFLTLNLREVMRRRRALDSLLLQIRLPKDNEVLADSAEALFNGLFSVQEGGGWRKRLRRYFLGQEQFSLEIVSRHGKIDYYMHVSRENADLLERQIYAQYPDANIETVDEHSVFFPGCQAEFTELVQKKHPVYPIRSYRDLAKEVGTQQLKEITIDSMSAITNAIGKLEHDEGAVVQMLVRPANDKWQDEGKVLVKEMHDKAKPKDSGPGDPLTAGEQEKVRNMESTVGKPGFETVIRIITTAHEADKAKANLKHLIAGFQQFNTVEYNALSQKDKISRADFFRSYVFRYFPLLNYKKNGWLFLLNPWLTKLAGETMIFNTEQLASLYHLPNKNIRTPQINWLKAKRAPAPQETPGLLHKEGALAEMKSEVVTPERILMGYNLYRGVTRDVCIKREDRRRHVYSIGRTGMGKSVFMENQIYQDIVNGEGVCVVDPHGDLARKCLEFVPKSRIDDVIYFDPSDVERPMGMNMLEAETPEQKDFAVQEMVSILYKLFAEFVGPRFEHIVRNSMLAIMEHPDGGTLVEMMRILTDDQYRDECVSHVKNPLVRAFWEEEMAQQVQFHKSEMLGPVLSKFGRFVSNDMMRNVIGQVKSAFSFRDVMDNQKILLINLAKGKVGDINCNLLGMIMVGKILMAALARTDMAEADRKDFYLYVDEFQNFATDSFATILSEARKYKLNLNVTHQYVGQLKEEIQKAVFGNVGTFISFRIGAPDAEMIAKEFKPVFDETDLLNLEKYTCYNKLLVDGVSTKGFSMHTYPPVKAPFADISEELMQLSRLKYGRDRKIVDEEVRRRGRLDAIMKVAE